MCDIYVYIYDLTKGMAKQFSFMFLGKHLDGVWHTGIVAFGQEWFFGNDGVSACPPKCTVLGEPNQMLLLGRTELTEDEFLEVVRQLSESSYKVGSYNLLEHNCNNFSNDLAQILVGKGIPAHIIDLPKEVLNSPLGPMLKPLLEQAADPIHQLRAGETPAISKLTSQVAQSAKIIERIPSTATLFKPTVTTGLAELLTYAHGALKLNNYNLLVEVKEYLEQADVKWSIASNHVKLLFNLFLDVLRETPDHRLTVLRLIQTVLLQADVAKLLQSNSVELIDKFVNQIKESNQPDVQQLSLQALSNFCTHKSISEWMLEKHQDIIFKDLSEFTLIETSDDMNTLIHEASISFFYNLVAAYHLEAKLSDAHTLELGCALLERMPKLKSKPKTIYQMLALVRACLAQSQNMRELASSMDFDPSKYQLDVSQAAAASTSTSNSADSYQSVLANIDELMQNKSNAHDDLD